LKKMGRGVTTKKEQQKIVEPGMCEGEGGGRKHTLGGKRSGKVWKDTQTNATTRSHEHRGKKIKEQP